MPLTSKKTTTIPARFIAPCGLNCRVCRGHLLRDTHPCPGCRGDAEFMNPSCVACSIRTCEKLAGSGISYCYDCDSFPCIRLKRLDKRYRTTYGMSAIANLLSIKDFGVRRFIRAEKVKWTCPACGSLRCVHTTQCPHCGHERRPQRHMQGR